MGERTKVDCVAHIRADMARLAPLLAKLGPSK
jgi:hypothetical protein